MNENYVVAVQGLAALDQVESLTPKIAQAAYRAINRSLDSTRTRAAAMILQQVNLPSSYLSPSNGRFKVKRRASSDNLEGSISAQTRSTSLARFATKGPNGKGAMVQVRPGAARYLPKAFFVNLRGAGGKTDAGNANQGLAIRLPAGVRPKMSRIGAKQIAKGLWLLYGPSVDQAFIQATDRGKDVAAKVSPYALDTLETEFLRLMGLD